MELKRAEETFTAEQGQLHLLMESMQDLVQVFDRELRLEAVYGGPFGDLEFADRYKQGRLGKTVLEQMGEAGRIHHDPAVRALAGESVTYEWLWEQSDPITWTSTQVFPRRNAAGEIVGVVSVSRDITHIKEADQAIRESEAKFRSLIAAMNDRVIVLDREQRHVEIYGAALGIDKQEWKKWIGKTTRELFGPELARVHEDAGRRALGGESVTYEWLWESPEGSHWFQTNLNPIRDAAGKITGLLSVSREITALKRAEEERRMIANRRHQSEQLESLGRLAGGVAHDFNNLLTVINGYCQMMLKKKSLPTGLRKRVEAVAQAGRQAAGLTKQLMAFGRRQKLRPEVLDLNESFNEIAGMVRRVIREDIRMEIQLDPRIGQVRADRNQVGQVIMNLVVNARDAMPRGGTLTVETAVVNVEEGDLGEIPRGSYVCLSVSDTGGGMDSETQKHVFEPFFTTKETGKGTGLGLSTVNGIVKQSGGEIVLVSEKGRGTSVKIYFPRVDGPAKKSPSAASLGLEIRGTETVLLVEDEQHVREYVREILEMNGYAVIVAADGASALGLPEERIRRVNLLLTDVVMPNLSGTDLAKRLWEKRPDLRVIFISGYPRSHFEGPGMSQKRFKLIPKPFQAETLLRAIRAILDDQPPDPT